MANVDFSFRKSNQLAKKDKSDEQQIDDKIKKLCDRINKTKDYYTTSSCSGRITIVRAVFNKSENAFLFKSHKLVSLDEIKKAIGKITKQYKKLVYFKQEPFILHVACSDLNKAEDLLDRARDAGIKRKGIITTRSRVIVELIGSEKLELPIMNKGKLLIDNDYLKFLIKEANARLGRSWERITNLEKQF